MEETRKNLDKISRMVQENVPLASLTSFRTGGPARYLLSPVDIKEAETILSSAAGNKLPLLVIGNGTNILVSDGGFAGIVLTTQRLNRMLVENERVICEPGVRLSSLVKTSLIHCLTGAEFLAGVPGTVGGAVISNAGLKTMWFSEIIEEVEVLPITGGSPHRLSRREINFGYRTSGLADVFICGTELRLKKGAEEEIKDAIAGHMKKRMSSQPLEYASAGSIFKNPPGAFAGELIEKCGMKGLCRGDAFVSDKHANFIVNKGNAKSGDIYGLIEDVREKVKKVYNIELELEIKLVGRF